MDDHRADRDRSPPESPNSLEGLGRSASAPPLSGAPPPADDCWEALIEFSLSRRAWWIEICEAFDLTPMQGHTLRSLDPERPVAMSVLADLLICDASNVTGIVDKLESRGLIARQGTDHDRRIKHLAVTERGRGIRDKLVAAIMHPPSAVAALPGDVKSRLTGLLRSLLSEGGLNR